MKFFLISLVLISTLVAGKINMPTQKYDASGSVTDIVIKKNRLYAATDIGSIDIFNLDSGEKIKSIRINKIKDFMGDEIDAKIFSVDIVGDKLLLLSQGMLGYNRVYIHENNKTRLLIADLDSLAIIKAKFLDKNTLLLALLSDEIISYNISEKKQNYRVSASESKFSDFVLSEDKTKVVVADESGDVQLLRVIDGAHIKTFNGQNLDNIFKIDYKNGIIATAGQDRRAVIYNEKTKAAYYKTSTFFIYCIGLSPSAKLAAYTSDVNNNITLFNTQTRALLAQFGGNKSTLSKILFLSEKEFLVSSDNHIINRYSIK